MAPTPPWPKGTAAAIARSLDIYYRDTDRTARMDRLNAQFVRPGGLAFDIGAHLGDRTASFLRLGASVVALEPQPAIYRALRLLHGNNDSAVLTWSALGAELGEVEIMVNSANPTTSTASRAFVDAAQSAAAWKGQSWDQLIRTPMTTLDQLIRDHGLPDFIKIDVEGHELEVLRGLSQPVRALSYEFTTLQRDIALAALARLADLGRYRFNLSLGEDHLLQFDDWVDAEILADLITTIPEAANSGDIYALQQ
ncbi:FkbM family methyltransferase [Gymnodinialimonas sp. 2305UL16-5]|uniref:FkbM family methyltransferase n=1 Tax=Gymnodinialimonas mytili TaxID=3126503 RepID=UPI0030A37BC3